MIKKWKPTIHLYFMMARICISYHHNTLFSMTNNENSINQRRRNYRFNSLDVLERKNTQHKQCVWFVTNAKGEQCLFLFSHWLDFRPHLKTLKICLFLHLCSLFLICNGIWPDLSTHFLGHPQLLHRNLKARIICLGLHQLNCGFLAKVFMNTRKNMVVKYH